MKLKQKIEHYRHNIFLFVMAVACAFLFSLGVWQLNRLAWKTQLIEQLDDSVGKNPMVFPFNNGSGIEHTEFQPIKFKGTYLHSQEIFVSAKYHKGRLGYHIISPVILDDKTILLANRGWTPTLKENEERGSVSRPLGKNFLEGIVRSGDKVRWFTPDNQPEKNLWVLADMDDMLEYFRQKNKNRVVRPIFVQVTKEKNAREYPIKLPATFKIRNDHLQYAFVWFSLSLITLIMSVFYARSELKPPKNRR